MKFDDVTAIGLIRTVWAHAEPASAVHAQRAAVKAIYLSATPGMFL